MEQTSPKSYAKIKNLAYVEYKKVNKVYCPHLKQSVKYNSNGFWHIVYKAKNKKREASSQLIRFKLLSKASKLLKLTTTLQEFDSYHKSISADNHGTKITKLTKIEYYGDIGIIDGWKIKVIVKKVGNGEPFFWSVIPNWVTNKKRDGKPRYQNSRGNLEED